MKTVGILIVLVLLVTGAPVLADSALEPRSGSAFQSVDTQAMQQDPFANPGMLWVDRGRALWHQQNEAGDSCQTCHGPPASMRGVATTYPQYDPAHKRLINLHQRIEHCRTKRLGLAPLPYEHDERLSLAALVTRASEGLAFDVQIDGAAAPFFARGRDYFTTRRGQLNLACVQCHESYVGFNLRGDRLSQGQITGYPAYRLTWQSLGSLHRRLRFCNQGVRATVHPAGSDVYVNLELYLAWRAANLPLESPSVRR